MLCPTWLPYTAMLDAHQEPVAKGLDPLLGGCRGLANGASVVFVEQ